MDPRFKRYGMIGAVAIVGATLYLGVSGQSVPPTLDTFAALLQRCGNGEIPKKSAGKWVCAADGDDSGGDITGVTAGSGLSGGGTTGAVTLDVGAASGGGLVVGSNDVGLITTCDAGQRLGWTGTAWACRRWNDYAGTYLEWSNEFITNNNTDMDTTVATGTGAAANTGALGAVSSQRIGVLAMETGSTNTGQLARRTNTSLPFAAMSKSIQNAIWSVPTLSTSGEGYIVYSGFADTTSAVDMVNGCYFVYDERNASAGGCNTSNLHKLEAFAASASNRTRVLLDGTSQDGACAAGAITTCDRTIAAQSGDTTGWQNLRVEMNGTSSCAFYVNDVLCATLTTNIPAATIQMWGGVVIRKTANSTTRMVYLDTSRMRVVQTGARSP